jgi:hypothetical protein
MNNYNKVVESEVIGVHQEGITVQKIKICLNGRSGEVAQKITKSYSFEDTNILESLLYNNYTRDAFCLIIFCLKRKLGAKMVREKLSRQEICHLTVLQMNLCKVTVLELLKQNIFWQKKLECNSTR